MLSNVVKRTEFVFIAETVFEQDLQKHSSVQVYNASLLYGVKINLILFPKC